MHPEARVGREGVPHGRKTRMFPDSQASSLREREDSQAGAKGAPRQGPSCPRTACRGQGGVGCSEQGCGGQVHFGLGGGPGPDHPKQR